MKKIILFVSLFIFLYIPNVNAEVEESLYINGYNSEYELLNSNIPTSCGLVYCSLDTAFDELYNYYDTNLKNSYPFWAVTLRHFYGENFFTLIFYYTSSSSITYSTSLYNDTIYHNVSPFDGHLQISGNGIIDTRTVNGNFDYFDIIAGFQSEKVDVLYTLYDTNINFVLPESYIINGFYNDSSLILEQNQPYPKIKDLIEYSSWNEYNDEQYTEVNLNNYHYVILSLKNYGRSQAYDVPLKVKGMIGITPVYNYGTIEKENITDRCNISYSDYTDYRLYILEQDLQNNAVYAVKSCENGSSFKFKNSDFNITYVTDDNVNDPVVTIDGVDYHTIPFDNLSVTANSNEENNFIPGESKQVTFSDVVSNITDTLGGLWNTLSAFMTLVTRFFRTLPSEFQTIAITSFTVMCTIGVIKFIRG